MNRILSKPLIILSLFLVLLAGIFCFQGVQLMDGHCSGDMSSVWCSDFLTHGTIISGVVLTSIFTIVSMVLSVSLVRQFFGLLTRTLQTSSYAPKVRDRIPIPSAIQIAFSKGIIHSRIP